MRFAGTLGRVRGAIILLYTAGVALLQLGAGAPNRLSWWLEFLFFFAWTISPVALTLIRRSDWVMTLGVGLIATVSLTLYGEAMLGSRDSSTDALIFVFMPFYQWIGVALVGVMAWFVSEGERHDA